MSGMRLSVASVILSLFLVGCDRSKVISGDYRLEFFEEGNCYYLVDSKHSAASGGPLEGIVERIGWDKEWLLVRVRKLYHGDPSGWYALSLTSKSILGPLSEGERHTNSAWSEISDKDPASVF